MAVPLTTPSSPQRDTARARVHADTPTPIPPWMILGWAGEPFFLTIRNLGRAWAREREPAGRRQRTESPPASAHEGEIPRSET